jgi:hypothetical protein
MNNELEGIWKEVQFKALFWYVTGVTEENHKNLRIFGLRTWI